MFEGFLELSKEVNPCSEGHGSTGDCVLMEGICLGQGRSFSHVQKSKHDFLSIGVVGFFIDCKIESDGVHPRDHCFIGAIEGFQFPKLELSRFG